MRVMTWNLWWRFGDWRQRRSAILAVLAHETGDFNAIPESDEVRRFGGDLTVAAVPGQILLDAWRFAPPGDPGYTWDRANPHVAGWIEPSSRIDYIHIGARGTGPGRVESVRRAAAAPVGGVWPSDHAAVVAELCEEVH